jgi:hypothetical protein
LELEPSLWVSTPSIFGILAANNHQRVGLSGGFLLGRPAYASRFVGGDYLLLIDPQLIAFAGGVIEMRASKNASVQLDDGTGAALDVSPLELKALQSAATGSPPEPVATPMVSCFQSNSTALLAEIRCAWQAQVGAVSVMDCSAGGTSP